MAGISGAGVATPPTYTTPSYDPLSSIIQQDSSALETETSNNEITNLATQANLQNLQTENSIRTAIQQAMHAIANQAESLSQQFIGDEIAQVKKGLENSGKAV